MAKSWGDSDSIKAAAREALDFWRRVAAENGGWTVRHVDVWLNEDGIVDDSVGIGEGDGHVIVYHGDGRGYSSILIDSL